MPRDRSEPWVDILIWPDLTKAIVRKTTFQPDERVAAKYGLTVHGEWVQVKEGEPYPEECVLPVTRYNEDVIGMGKDAWARLRRRAAEVNDA